MRKRTKVYDCVEDWLDALTPDERWRLHQQIMADRQANVSSTQHLDEPPPTLH